VIRAIVFFVLLALTSGCTLEADSRPYQRAIVYRLFCDGKVVMTATRPIFAHKDDTGAVVYTSFDKGHFDHPQIYQPEGTTICYVRSELKG
jgi:hypothetical protein